MIGCRLGKGLGEIGGLWRFDAGRGKLGFFRGWRRGIQALLTLSLVLSQLAKVWKEEEVDAFIRRLERLVDSNSTNAGEDCN